MSGSLVNRGFKVDVDDLLRNVPGGITLVQNLEAFEPFRGEHAYPSTARVFPKAAACEGCGALVAPYAHQCDYCRRVK